MNAAYPSPSPQTTQYGTATIAAGADTSALTERLTSLLEARGLDPEVIARLGVLASSRLSGDCIAIPYLLSGKPVQYKYRTLGATKAFATDKGFKSIPYNVDCLSDPTLTGPLLVVEGEPDVWAAIQSGFPRVISVPSGAPAEAGDGTGKRYDWIEYVLPHVRDDKEIILAVDGDGPGANLLHDLSLRFGRHRCKYIRYPEGTKDLNDIVDVYSELAVRHAIEDAPYLKVEGVFRLSELPPINAAPALSTGIVSMDDIYKVRTGDVTVLTGMPGHGKTSLANEVACRMADKHKWNTVFCSLEQSPQVDHRRALRSYHSQEPEFLMGPAAKAKADAWIDDYFSFIVANEDEDTTLTWLLQKLAAAVIRYNAKMTILDPWNELDHTHPPDMTQTQYVGFAIRQFKRFARKYGVHFIVCAHPSKMRRDRDGNFPMPTLYDISDSAHWANKADLGLVVHRPNVVNSEAQIWNVKSRYRNIIGAPGMITGVWDDAKTRYTITS